MVTLFIMLFIINAFNFIDGIDGLSSGLGIIASLVFGYLFYQYDQYLMSMLAFSLCGALLGFIPFNFQKAKIFMGDTGTMTIGFILSILAIYFMELSFSATEHKVFNFNSAAVLVLSALIIPIVDMIRVFTIRIISFSSPFSPDKRHIHHQLIKSGFSQAQTCIILYATTILFIGASWLVRGYSSLVIFYLFLLIAFVLSQLPHILWLMKKQKQMA